jgi:hypothetical protein
LEGLLEGEAVGVEVVGGEVWGRWGEHDGGGERVDLLALGGDYM